MLIRTTIVILCLGSSFGLGAEPPKPVTPVEAIKQIGKPEVLVEMVVKLRMLRSRLTGFKSLHSGLERR